MPSEYVCKTCGRFFDEFYEYYCPSCQHIICEKCIESHPWTWPCVKCGWSAKTRAEAINNDYACPTCYVCPYCKAPVEIVAEKTVEGESRYVFECGYCLWNSGSEAPDSKWYIEALSEEWLRKKAVSLYMPRLGLREVPTFLCSVCHSTLVSPKGGAEHLTAKTFPRVTLRLYHALVKGVEEEVEITVKNTRSKNVNLRFDWKAEGTPVMIASHTRSHDFDFSGFEQEKSLKLILKPEEDGTFYIIGEVWFSFEEISLGQATTYIRLGPIYVVPRITVKKELPGFIETGKEIVMKVRITNESSKDITRVIIEEGVLPEGMRIVGEDFFSIPRLAPGDTKEYSYKVVFEKSGRYSIPPSKIRIKIPSIDPNRLIEIRSNSLERLLT